MVSIPEPRTVIIILYTLLTTPLELQVLQEHGLLNHQGDNFVFDSMESERWDPTKCSSGSLLVRSETQAVHHTTYHNKIKSCNLHVLHIFLSISMQHLLAPTSPQPAFPLRLNSKTLKCALFAV